MKCILSSTPSDLLSKELVVVFFSDIGKLDASHQSRIKIIVESEDWKDEVGKSLLIRTENKKILLVGFGDPKNCTMLDWQTIFAGVSRKAKDIHVKTISIALPIDDMTGKTSFSPEQLVQGAVEGMCLGSYEFLKHKSQKNIEHSIENVTFTVDTRYVSEATRGVTRGEYMAQATIFARDLVNEPSSVTTPTFLSLIAQSMAKEQHISCEIFGKKEMEKFGMGGVLGIAKGSDEEPKFITLSYTGLGKKTIVIIGKGVTFDSGGLSLKPDKSMETMKLDMAGAASILGIFSVLPFLAPHVNVIGLIPAVENMPSGKAIKPGDVVKAYNGKTIEIISTDAEGRVILADALSYAATFHPDAIIDLATLTGACSIALGEEIAGLFANEKTLAEQLLLAGKYSGERLWELPMAKEYEEQLKSPVADMKNVGKTRAGGAITGALFLKPFVPENIPWAHIDIGGTAWDEKNTPFCPVGGTGYGVRLMLEYFKSF